MGNNTPTLRQDGAHPADIAEYRLETLQRRLEQAEEVGNTKLAQRLEQEVDEAMEAMLEFGGEQGGGEMDFDSDVDDADLLRALDEDNSSDDGSIRFSNRGRNKRARLELHKEDKELSNRLDHPVSFSKIDARSLRMLDEVVEIASSSLSTGAAGEVFKKFPLLKKATQLKCEIKAGEILYLPAG